MTSLEECLQQRWGAIMPEGGQEQGSTRTPMPYYEMRSHEEDCEMMTPVTAPLLMPGEAYWQALVATHLLEERMERLSWSSMRMRLDNHQCSHSQGHLRRQLRGHWWRCTKTPAGRDHQRDLRGRQTLSPSPSPTRLRRCVTFQDQESSSEEDPLTRQCMGWSPDRRKSEEYDIGPPPTLQPELEYFLRDPTAIWGAEGDATCHQSPLWRIMKSG